MRCRLPPSTPLRLSDPLPHDYGTRWPRKRNLGGPPGLWALLMGVSLLGGGVLALVIAMTRVVLPYDESMVGMSRFELSLVNDRLLDFMTHDRVTLAGTMLALGTLYSGLAWWGIRRGEHWAERTAVVVGIRRILFFLSLSRVRLF